VVLVSMMFTDQQSVKAFASSDMTSFPGIAAQGICGDDGAGTPLRMLSKWSVRGEQRLYGPSLCGGEGDIIIGLPMHIMRSVPGGGDAMEPKAQVPAGVQDLLQRLQGALSSTGGRRTGTGPWRSPRIKPPVIEAGSVSSITAAAGLLERRREVSPRRR
jgi:hypothetical protein